MSFLRRIKDLDKKFSFSFLGVLIGIAGFGFAIYSTYFESKSPGIRFEILTNADVVDLREEIGKLDIIFDGTSIKTKNKSLRIITIKVTNNGNGNILKAGYDENAPLGFYVNDAEIIEKPVLIDASNNYLKDNLRITPASANRVSFSSVILEKQDYYIVKVLALSSKGLIPKVTPTGKVAGVKSIEIVDSFNLTGEKSFLNKIREGSIFIHLIRFISYIVIVILFLLISMVPILLVRDSLETKRRKREINKFKNYTKIEINDKIGTIFDLFLEEGERPLIELQTLFSNKEKLKKLMKIVDIRKEDYKKEINEKYGIDDVPTVAFRDMRKMIIVDIPLRNELLVKELMEKEIVKVEDEKVSIDKEFEKTLNEFFNFIRL